jgi:hypothetical protein
VQLLTVVREIGQHPPAGGENRGAGGGVEPSAESVILGGMFMRTSGHRPAGFLRHFFNPAVQFVTTVRGGAVAASPPVAALTRNRWPSDAGR